MDFGTTNSTASYVEDGDKLAAFRFPGPDGYEYIPSCVAYEPGGLVSVGRAALDLAGDPDVVFCNNLKMVLPLSEDGRAKYAWTREKDPETAVADYLGRILSVRDAEECSFSTQKGDIDGVVISVPHVWAKDPKHMGRPRLQSLIAETMKLPLIQLISEPVAAAACYAFRSQKDSRPFRGNLLICDMGGGTFDVTLCRVSPGEVEELHNDGNGRFDLGKAGVRFDRRLISEGLKKKGVTPDENSPEFHKIYKDLQDFKANHHAKITQIIINAIEDPDLRGTPVFRSGGLTFTFDDIQTAFREIEEGIAEVLGRFVKEIEAKGHSIDAVYFVGGFSQFYLVREAVKKALNISNGDARLVADANREMSRFAISYGAALIANDLVSVEEKYEHTIGIEMFQLVPNGDALDRREIRVPIVRGGKKMGEYEHAHFAEREVRAYNEKPPVTIFVDLESKNRVVRQKLPDSLDIRLPNAHIRDNRWKVGMWINKSKVVYLVFEDVAEGRRAQYELGDILRQMFDGLEIVPEEGGI